MLVEYQATKGWSEYTKTQLARAGQNIQPMTKSGKVNYPPASEASRGVY